MNNKKFFSYLGTKAANKLSAYERRQRRRRAIFEKSFLGASWQRYPVFAWKNHLVRTGFSLIV
jgi:hypothetical protein